MIADVGTDTNGGGMWRFDDAAMRYFRLEADSTISGVIEGRFLPDPEILWQKRLDLHDVPKNSGSGMRLRPQPATFMLWHHWQGVNHNALIDA